MGLAGRGLLPPAARRLDDAAGRIGGLFYSHFSGVEQDGVDGLHQRRGRAAGIAFVAGADIGQDLLQRGPLVLELQPATLGLSRVSADKVRAISTASASVWDA